ncbi:MAG: ATP-dependent helicase UvrD/PcrA [Sphingomonadales bacterium]|jgi:DNA helicase-2/ATP-dependent DNA helicase PcrA|nr:ATP-dependent helicase UvrD/PcrA [Sphingomonadales bacterium]
MTDQILAEDPDAGVDQQIFDCVNPEGLRSFFLYAGAGSGKTRSLVNTLNFIRERYGAWLWLRGKRVAVITYTNAAADEIKRRAKSDPLFEVSTIHSFVWSLLAGYNHDIREWLRCNLASEIAELESAQLKGRSASKAAEQRARSILSKQERLGSLDEIRVFSYNPNGDNRERDSLNHAEVIKMGSEFIASKPALRRLLASKFPVLLIDESQDTNKLLVDALLHFEEEFRPQVCVGFFGDMMQRIYADGKAKLPDLIPESWARPSKVMNHRSPARIVRLINQIRSEDDDHVQQHRPDKLGGLVRLFVAPWETEDRFKLEDRIRQRMSEVTGDEGWTDQTLVKTLGLEHHMLARRMGFAELFAPLYAVDRLKTGLLDGSLPALRLFTADVLPTVAAQKGGEAFLVAAILRKRSPLLQAQALKRAESNQAQNIASAREAVVKLCALWDEGADPPCRDVLRVVAETGLFQIPDSLRAYVERADELHDLAAILAGIVIDSDGDPDEEEGEVSAQFSAWDSALDAPMSQMEKYSAYISGESAFDTHQGVKGLQFPRVMVVVDDQEARGFMFSYEKLLGAKALSSTDLKREQEGEETTVHRTRRLLYVTASRAEESLAIVTYSADPARVKATVVGAEWFTEDEVELIEPEQG